MRETPLAKVSPDLSSPSPAAPPMPTVNSRSITFLLLRAGIGNWRNSKMETRNASRAFQFSSFEFPVSSKSDFPAALDCLEHGHFVGEFELRAYRNTHRNPRDSHAQRLDQLGQIDGRCFPFHVRIRRDDKLTNLTAFQPLNQ